MFPDGKPANSIYAIEAENFAWIDFFWSTMGRSGSVGSDVELVYDKLQSEPALRKLLDNLVDGIDRDNDLPGPDRVTAYFLKEILHRVLTAVKERERCTPETELSDEAEAGLRKYLEGPIIDQINAGTRRQYSAGTSRSSSDTRISRFNGTFHPSGAFIPGSMFTIVAAGLLTRWLARPSWRGRYPVDEN